LPGGSRGLGDVYKRQSFFQKNKIQLHKISIETGRIIS
jgi:hypothetical protein